jgi:hypothetical protein
MTSSDRHEITLHLNDIRYLFEAPIPDPALGRFSEDSGIDVIINELEPRSLRRPLHTTLALPANQLTPDIEAKTLEAIRHYCTVQLRWVENEQRAVRRLGMQKLQIGLFFLATCLFLSAFWSQVGFLPEFLQTFLVEGFIIVGWVSLWHPVEILLYEWWPHRRDAQHYKHIRDNMTLTVIPEA